MRSFNAQEIANTLLAFAKMEHVDIPLLQVQCTLDAFPSSRAICHCCLLTQGMALLACTVGASSLQIW